MNRESKKNGNRARTKKRRFQGNRYVGKDGKRSRKDQASSSSGSSSTGPGVSETEKDLESPTLFPALPTTPAKDSKARSRSRLTNKVISMTNTTSSSDDRPALPTDSEHIKSEEIARGKWIAMNMITYKDPTGKVRSWEGVTRTTKLKMEADAVGMITLLKDPAKKCECVILVRQYRPAIQTTTIEFPAGLIDAGETAEYAAIREMKEETGFTVKVQHVSPATATDAGILDSTMKMVICEVDSNVHCNTHSHPIGDSDEFTEVLIEPLHSLVTKLSEYSNNGEIIDSRVYTWALAKSGH